MAQTRIYHWKHGWIPLDHAAALSKAHGSEHGARRALAVSHAAGHAHSSVVAGEYGGGTHERGLQPVALDHLPRERRITAAFSPQTRRFGLQDPEGRAGFGTETVTTSIPEHLAEHFHANGYTVHRLVNTPNEGHKISVRTRDGSFKLFRADGSDIHDVEPIGHAGSHQPATHTFKPVTVADALGPDTRTHDQRLRDAYVTKYGTGKNVHVRDRIEQKVKAAFRDDNGHTVLIEPALTKAQTHELLDSVHHVTTAASISTPIRVHVPTGDTHFRGGNTLGYVARGLRTIHVSPKVASGETQPKGTDHFMPAHDQTTTLRYTLAHELGHIIDFENEHTLPRVTRTPSGMAIPTGTPTEAVEHFHKHRTKLSRYGKSNVHEGYAEAFAQWTLDKGANDPVARDYARRYGWK
jgi:hypothetical protein